VSCALSVEPGEKDSTIEDGKTDQYLEFLLPDPVNIPSPCADTYEMNFELPSFLQNTAIRSPFCHSRGSAAVDSVPVKGCRFALKVREVIFLPSSSFPDGLSISGLLLHPAMVSKEATANIKGLIIFIILAV